MEYAKPPLSLDQQAELLISRGLQADKAELLASLEHVNYYRASGYLFPFRNQDDSFRPGTSLSLLTRIYDLDRKLRNLILLAMDTIEVSIRTTICYTFTLGHGPFGYVEQSNLPGIDIQAHRKLLDSVDTESRRSREEFVEHFFARYGDTHPMLPLWMAVEILSFGTLVSLYRGLGNGEKQAVARRYGVPDVVLTSWIVGLNGVRNVCAHHGRLYNRRLGYQFLLPNERKYPHWHRPVRIPNNSTFSALSICAYLMDRIDTSSDWKSRARDVLRHYVDIETVRHSLPERWEQSTLWLQARGIV